MTNHAYQSHDKVFVIWHQLLQTVTFATWTLRHYASHATAHHAYIKQQLHSYTCFWKLNTLARLPQNLVQCNSHCITRILAWFGKKNVWDYTYLSLNAYLHCHFHSTHSYVLAHGNATWNSVSQSLAQYRKHAYFRGYAYPWKLVRMKI